MDGKTRSELASPAWKPHLLKDLSKDLPKVLEQRVFLPLNHFGP